jgi:Skp family chaperone for outer membrane proteins
MRYQWITTVAAAICLMSANGVQAADAGQTSSRGLRIGYVDLDRVAEQSAMVKKRVSRVETDLREKQKSYRDKAERLRELRRDLATRESVLTEAQIAEKQAEIRNLRDELDFLQYQANRTLNDTSRNVIEPVLDQVLMAVERVAGKYEIDIVLRGDLVLFASERVDLTKHVIYELDHNANAGKAGAAVKPLESGTEETKSTAREKTSTKDD